MSGDIDEREFRIRRWVDEAGLLMEGLGMPRMAGRVLGHLLVCAPAEQSAAQLADALLASAGSISSATRYLIQTGVVERRHRRGERRDYYVLNPGVWARLMRQRMLVVTELRVLADRGLAVLGERPAEETERLRETRDYFAFAERVVPETLDRWDREREQQP